MGESIHDDIFPHIPLKIPEPITFYGKDPHIIMKKHTRFPGIALACLALVLGLAACGRADADAPPPTVTTEAETKKGTEVETKKGTEAATDPVADTQESTPPETEADTAPDGHEPETGPVFENTTPTPADPVAGSGALSKPYAEGHTFSNGSVTLGNAGVTMDFTSEFYGHDSAIDRDLMQYGWRFENIRLPAADYKGECFLAELTGDHYADMVRYADGVLEIYPAVVTTNRTFEYNGQTFDSVYGDANSKYDFGEPVVYALNLPDATLRGVGDFDGNGYADMLFVAADGAVTLGLTSEAGITPVTVGRYHGYPSALYAGDVNADGKCDLLMVLDHEVTSFLNTEEGFRMGETVTLPFANEYLLLQVGDINNDRRADVIWAEKGEEEIRYRTVFGRGDGFFGPHPEELGNTNLYAVSEEMKTCKDLQYFAVGDLTGDGVPDLLYRTPKIFGLGFNTYDPPYDYSLFGFIAEDGTYRIYSGGRWYDQSEAVKDSTNGQGTGDGDHVMIYESKDGLTWDRYLEGPAFYLGWEQGLEGDLTANELWWTGNTLEPEVIYVDGVYHMLIQSSGVTESGYYGDYIGYASSTDGIHFTRKVDSPVILPEPGKTFAQFKEVYGAEYGFNHHELIYVADDPEGKCFWLYTGHHKNGGWAGYVLIRSADPTCFYWSDREETSGFAQLGNQVGYISDYDGEGNRLFFRITFHDYTDENGTRLVPTLYYSTDGRSFHHAGMSLAGVDVTDPAALENNRNIYFLGFCTVNGTGELPRNEDGSYKLTYLATTANEPGGMPIFWAEAGFGVMNFTLAQ